eukprot:GHVU01134371.1.p1 GENE.GHVU01134371.1~~GHVU01134371.1.p1  ORF type:complete len:106 (-),score=8.17 GHVU01134371.1:180-497(-)
MSCASTLEELRIRDYREFAEGVRGDFRVLRKVAVDGIGASRWFATIAMRCASTLEELQIRVPYWFVRRLPTRFANLRRLTFEGDGANICEVTVPETCVQMRNTEW